MTKKKCLALGILAITIFGFIALQIFFAIDMKNFKEGLGETSIESERNAEAEQKEKTPKSISDTPINGHTEEIPLQESRDLDVLNADRTNSSSEKIELSEAEIEARIKAQRKQQLAEYIAKWGEPPSPDGSYQHTFDNHGNILRHYRGTSIVSHYRIEIGFAPTISELKRYKQLRTEMKEAKIHANFEEANRIHEKIQTLVNSAQDEVPVPFGYAYYGDQITQGQEKNLDNRAVKSFYKRMGVPHLFELYKEGIY